MKDHATKHEPARRALWTLGMLLTGLILLRAGSLAPESPAYAEMVADSGAYTVLTTKSGTEELLYVIDDREEQLLVYRVRGTRSIELADRQDLRQMFTAARAAYLGGGGGP
jgi:hypothetical protein